MNQTDEIAGEVCEDHENKLAVDWDYNNTIEDSKFEDMEPSQINDAASEFARLLVLMQDDVQIQADFIASSRSR